MNIKILLYLFILINFLSCKKKKLINQKDIETDVNCKNDFPFLRAKSIQYLKNKKGDSILLNLSYDRDNCYLINNVNMYEIKIKMQSQYSRFNFNFGLGIKNDTLFSSLITGFPKEAQLLQPFLDLNKSKKIKRLHPNILFSRVFSIDSIYYINNEKIFRINIFRDNPLGESQDGARMYR